MMAENNELWDDEGVELLRALLSLQTVEDAQNFLRDLMTEDEIHMVIDRWRVARLLHQGRSYRDIEASTGLIASIEALTHSEHFS